MCSYYKNKYLLKFQPFYTSKIEKSTKKTRTTKNVTKKPKVTNKQLSQALPFHPKKTKKPKELTKRQIFQYIFPFSEAIVISKRARALRGYVETYNVEVIDNNSLNDSLFLAKSYIIDFLKDTLATKRSYKYSILAIITLKRWNSAINAWKFQNI